MKARNRPTAAFIRLERVKEEATPGTDGVRTDCFLEKFGLRVPRRGDTAATLRRSRPCAVVIGELKLSFTLDLVLQAMDCTAACDDEVCLAVRAWRRGRSRDRDPRVRKLCRLFGLSP